MKIGSTDTGSEGEYVFNVNRSAPISSESSGICKYILCQGHDNASCIIALGLPSSARSELNKFVIRR